MSSRRLRLGFSEQARRGVAVLLSASVLGGCVRNGIIGIGQEDLIVRYYSNETCSVTLNGKRFGPENSVAEDKVDFIDRRFWECSVVARESSVNVFLQVSSSFQSLFDMRPGETYDVVKQYTAVWIGDKPQLPVEIVPPRWFVNMPDFCNPRIHPTSGRLEIGTIDDENRPVHEIVVRGRVDCWI